MIKILNIYIFRYLSVATFFITLVITALLWLSQSLRFVETLLYQGSSFTLFLKMVFFLIPDLVSLMLPIATLLGVLFTCYRLTLDHELLVMQTSGMSHLALSKPVFSFAALVTVALYSINLYVMPTSFQKFRAMEHEMRHNVAALIQTGEFKTLKNITFYVKSYLPSGDIQGIFLYDARNPQQPITFTAETGKIQETPQGLTLAMFQGTRQQIDPKNGKPTLLFFDAYTVDLSLFSAQSNVRPKKPYERFLGDLLNPDLSMETPGMVKKLYAEAHQRLILPLTVFSFCGLALGIFLRFPHNRRSQSKKIVSILGLCGLLQILILTFINLSEKTSWAIPLAYGVVFLSLSGSFLMLCEEKSWKRRPWPGKGDL